MVSISVPSGSVFLEARLPVDRLLFSGELKCIPALQNFEEALHRALERPIGSEPLRKLVSPRDKILILVDDNTRNTPVCRILPGLLNHLQQAGVGSNNIEILVAGGTHRLMTPSELEDKIGAEVMNRIKVSQHDFRDLGSLEDLGQVHVGRTVIPVQVNRKAVEADFVIGIGDIIPHCDAGFSGGAKIVQPGICGYATTAATHVAAAVSDKIPLGVVENPCRLGMEEVARRVGLSFIVNVVKNCRDEIAGVFAGDMVEAHRQGVQKSRESFGVSIPALADTVIVSSHPCDIDFWQAEKGLVSANEVVRKGGIVIFVAPCPEGLEHNHPGLRDWLKLSNAEARAAALAASVEDERADLIAADVAVATSEIREKAEICIVSDGLSWEESLLLGHRKFADLQKAVDYAFQRIPGGTVGVLPRGGDCLPIVEDHSN